MNSIFQLFSNLLELIVGVAALTIVLSQWKPSIERILFAAIAACFVVRSAFMFLFTAIILDSPQFFRRSNSLFSLLFSGMYYLQPLLPTIAISLVLVLALRLRNNVAAHSNSFLEHSDPVNDNPDSSIPSNNQGAFAESWKTDLSAVSRINILRKREWAFTADVLPAVAINALVFWSVSLTSSGYFTTSLFSQMATSLIALVTFMLGFYILFKDSVRGRSWGKRLVDCRVVNHFSGEPIGAAESMARNFIFLIPFAIFVELAVASLRMDRRRMGDLIANTTVVHGEPDFIYGADNPAKRREEEAEPAQPHPLD